MKRQKEKMNVKKIFKPAFEKVLITILLVLALPNFAYWSCCLKSPCPSEYKIHLGYWVLLLQTGIVILKCGKFTYFYFWPLSLMIAYPISCILYTKIIRRLRK
jgi:hypothetical protein